MEKIKNSIFPFIFVLTLCIGALLATSVIDTREKEISQRQKFEDHLISITKTKVQEQVDIALNAIRFFYQLFLEDRLTREVAMEMAKNQIRSLRYGQDGYFWIDNKDCILQVLPQDPSREGEDRKNWVDSQGVRYVWELVKGATDKGGVFVRYRFPRLLETQPKDKIGFARYFEPWGWVVGTGFYLEDLENEIYQFNRKLTEETSGKILLSIFLAFVSLIALSLTLYWFFRRTKP